VKDVKAAICENDLFSQFSEFFAQSDDFIEGPDLGSVLPGYWQWQQSFTSFG
jgi:hypothetical protein